MDDQNEYRAALSRRKVLGLAAGATLGAAVQAAPRKSAARVNEIVLMDATVLSRAIHSRRISCAEVMNAYLDHIGQFNPKVNAWDLPS